MNGLFAKRIGVILSGLFLVSTVSFSQFNNSDFLIAGPEDGMKILQAYITPWTNAFGAGVNGSWYNTAKPHKLGGFDITLGFNLGFVPSSANTFDVTKIGLKTFTGTGLAPTIAGPNKQGPLLSAPTVAGFPNISFNTPPGANWGILPVPTLQAGIGLPLGTELKVRFIPKILISGNDISSWGLGIMHSISQYIPGVKSTPFNISLLGGYNKLSGHIKIDFQPDQSIGVINYTAAYPLPFKDQKMSATVEAWNVGVVASADLPIITFYGGLGYCGTKTVVNLTGNYPFPTVNPSVSTTKYVYEDKGVLKGFPKMEIKNYSGIRTNIGLRLKFGVFTFHADYAWAQYSVVSTGLGLSFR